jgi:hypothetical protein
MPGIALPGWGILPGKVTTILKAIAAEEKIVDPAREFLAEEARWRGWVEKQQSIALVNVILDSVQPAQAGSGSRHSKMFDATINLDMYVLGTYVEQTIEGVTSVMPADRVAASRLYLLTAQVLHAITRKDNQDLGFVPGTIGVFGNLSLSLWSQENEQATGQYAPARWSFTVGVPFVPQEGPDLPDLTELNIEMKQLLESWGAKFTYPLGGEGA